MTFLSAPKIAGSVPKRSIEDWLSGTSQLTVNSESLLWKPCGTFQDRERTYTLPRYLFIGPRGGDDPIRIGLFGSLHGDQPESTSALLTFLKILEAKPELARNYFLFVYPICNPTGFEDDTRGSRRGRDLNREFWNNSREPEISLLQSEICTHALDGIISLHTDDSSSGLYAFTRSYTVGKNLVEPALAAADPVLPRDTNEIIDGFPAKDGVVRAVYAGAISGPPKIRPRPFEIALCAPRQAARYQAEQGLVLALQSILANYRELRAYAQNL
jgi:murein peptide amidase A